MDTDRFELVRTLAAEALRLGPGDRRALVLQRCGADETLVRDVMSTIEAAEQATLMGASQTDPFPSELPAVGTISTPAGASTSPGRIGSYTILETLGQGGMGLVYLARQERTERTVALKVIRPGLSSPESLRRFELEGRTLARLQHPGIAQIFDAGVVRRPDGLEQPYVALEHVRGVDIRTHASGASLNVADRVRLVILVCQAVQHAHTKGVIHRDLKPGNILVDPTGQPKVLDFGVARLADSNVSGAAATQAGQIVGTVPYMSPEQIAGDPDAMDTRTDVYSLGVVLYELLTGRLPLDVLGKTIVEAARVIESTNAAPIGLLNPELSDDLQTIVGAAMHKDRALRYQSAAEFAADLERYLRDEPVLARPASAMYKARKFVRRNRPLVALGAAAIVLLALGSVGTAWQAVRATRGWEAARIEGAAAAAANEFLVNTISSADPENNLGQLLTVRHVLDEMSTLARTELAEQPRVEWGVRSTLARTYRSLDALEEAERHARRAYELASSVFGQNSIEATRAEREIGMILAQAGKFDEAEVIARRNLEAVLAIASNHPDVSIAMGALARVLQETGRWDQAEPLLRGAVTLGVATRGERDPEVLVAMHNLATSLKDAGQLPESEQLMRRVLELRRSVHGDAHPQTAYSMNNLAATLQKLGRTEESLDLFRQTLDIRTAALGPEHQSTLTTRMNLAVCLITLGRLEEAEPHVRDGLDGYRRTLGESHAKSLIAMGNLAYLLEEQGRLDEAEAMYRAVVELRRSTQGGKDPETWASMNNLAMLLQTRGNSKDAEPILRELVDMCQQSLPPGHYYTALFANNLGDVLLDLGRLDEAEPLLRESLAVIITTLGVENARAVRGRGRIERLETLRSERLSGSR